MPIVRGDYWPALALNKAGREPKSNEHAPAATATLVLQPVASPVPQVPALCCMQQPELRAPVQTSSPLPERGADYGRGG